MGKKAKQPEKPSTAWLGTYGDMITLMLCFFVMLYNPSEVDVTQMATITQSLQMQETETTSGAKRLTAFFLAIPRDLPFSKDGREFILFPKSES